MSVTVDMTNSENMVANFNLLDMNVETRVIVSTIGSYEEMLEWRQGYLDWLVDSTLYGSYRIALLQLSRTWLLDIFFADVRDAVLFKLTWA